MSECFDLRVVATPFVGGGIDFQHRGSVDFAAIFDLFRVLRFTGTARVGTW